MTTLFRSNPVCVVPFRFRFRFRLSSNQLLRSISVPHRPFTSSLRRAARDNDFSASARSEIKLGPDPECDRPLPGAVLRPVIATLDRSRIANTNTNTSSDESERTFTFREARETESEYRRLKAEESVAGAFGGGTQSQIAGLGVVSFDSEEDTHTHSPYRDSTSAAASGVNMVMPAGPSLDEQSDAAFMRGVRSEFVREAGLNRVINKLRRRTPETDIDAAQNKLVAGTYELSRGLPIHLSGFVLLWWCSI